ncbi:MAG: hypothetical protein HYV27_03075 [Candidatus Hydrogenedentes bacterium]|nr:hypothetical protein [Candidatus Hydrogenedentota bacterium]
MGLPIGQSVASFSAARAAEFAQASRKAVVDTAVSESNRLTGRNPEAEAARQSERTTSPQGLALRTLSINLEEARQLVPTLEEVQARAREARTERPAADGQEGNALRRETRESQEEVRAPLESVRPDPSPQVRRFEENDGENRDAAADRNAPEDSADAPPEERSAPARIDIRV